MEDKKRSVRIWIAISFLLIWAIILMGRISYLMLFNKENAKTSITNNKKIRGTIMDRNGEILAIQIKLFSLSAWMPSVEDIDSSIKLLSPILDIKEEELRDKLNSSKGFLYIKRRLSPSAEKEINKLIASGKLPGFSLQPEYTRIYPLKSIGSHVVGYSGTDNRGLDGVEYTMDSILMSSMGDVPYSGGNNIFLTIDSRIQHITDNFAEELKTQHKAKDVMILLADAKTGEILAYSAAPGFDCNLYPETTIEQRTNYPISYSYEPGSVFKIFSLASFLEIGGIDSSFRTYCPGYYVNTSTTPNIKINCLGTHGEENITDILVNSCNTGAAYASDTVSDEEFYRLLIKLGFGNKTGIALNGESAGVLNSPEKWSLRSKPTIAIGQEIGVTAIQMIKAATAIANKGTLLEPQIIKKITTQDGKIIKESKPVRIDQVFSPSTTEIILQGMQEAVERGTAKRAKLDFVNIAAKTGTAQKLDPKTGKYSKTDFIASTMSFIPADNPSIIAYIVIDSPHGESYYGGRIAAPAIAELIKRVSDYIDIKDNTEKTHLYSDGKTKIPVEKLPIITDVIPDFTGLSKATLMPLLLRDDIKVNIKGSGWVVRQNPEPGTPFKKGMSITLELE
ncbi:penicillin-binding transpeptidase domain-containing protein [Spirochaetia bacterium 38H-sp]|uniref:Penicillin-binding transpeptidase domain-containing protein n=1 Tax=Rarispira pelagica TaxID=3141764 RepID=A0ABU9UDI4_9SPIR